MFSNGARLLCWKWVPAVEFGWRRRSRRVVFCAYLGLAVVSSFLMGLAFYFRQDLLRTEIAQRMIGPKRLPPLYKDIRQQEQLLPHQLTTTPFAKGEKYLWVASHSGYAAGSGWGNVMQDYIITAHLTYAAGRGFVFDDYSWDRYGPAFSTFNGKLIPSRIPLSAIVSGPIVGGRFAENDSIPLSISKPYWDKICRKKYVVHGQDVRAVHGEDATALQILETWVSYLSQIDHPCVEVDRHSGNIFHPFIFGRRNDLLTVWPSLSRSPILTLYDWSALAHATFEANRALFATAPLTPIFPGRPACADCVDPFVPVDGLLALHIRRGDFLEHCPNLCNWWAAFNGFNDFEGSLDRWEHPYGSEDERMAVYLRRCLPTILQIVEKVEEVRQSPAGNGLRSIYVMTNADPSWLSYLKQALLRAHRWERIVTSRDLTLTWEQKFVSQTVDMLIGEHAQVLVGNGFSSLTSNIVMLRTARGFPPGNTRMW